MQRTLALCLPLTGILAGSLEAAIATPRPMARAQDSTTEVYERAAMEEDPEKRLALAEQLLGFPDLSDLGHAEGHRFRGMALRALERPDEAKAAYLKGLEYVEDDKDLLLQLGDLAFHSEDFDQAEDCFRRLCAAHEDVATGYINLGKVLLRRDRGDEAKSVYLQAKERFPLRYDVYVGLGIVAGMEGHLSRAAEMQRIAIGWDPDGPDLAALETLLGLLSDEATLQLARAAGEFPREPSSWRAYLLHLFQSEQFGLGALEAQDWQNVQGPGERRGEAVAEEALFHLTLGRAARAAARLRLYLDGAHPWDMRAALIYHHALGRLGIPLIAGRDLAMRKDAAPRDTGWYGHLVDYVLEREESDDMEEWIWEASGAHAQQRKLEMRFFQPGEAPDLQSMAAAAEEIQEELPESWVARAVLSRAKGWGEPIPGDDQDFQDYLDAAPDGSTLRLPSTEYQALEGLRIEGRRNLTIVGSGIFAGDGVFAGKSWATPPTRIVVSNTKDAPANIVISGSRGILFRGCELDCQGSKSPAVLVENSQGVSFETCTLLGKALGFRVQHSRDFRLTKSRFVGLDLVMRITDTQDISIVANRFDQVRNIWGYQDLYGRVMLQSNWIDEGFWTPRIVQGQYR